MWQLVMPLTVAIPLVLVWQLVPGRGNILIPTFSTFAIAVGQTMLSAEFWQALATSELALLVGYLAAIVVGIPLGMAMGRYRWLEAAADPYVNIALITPLALVMPIVLMVFGLTFQARVVVIFMFAITFVVVPCRAGILTITENLWEMCRGYGASELQLWRELLLPGSLPAVMTGLRQGLAHAISGMLLAELTLLAVGLGKLILDAQGHYDSATIFAVVFLLIVQSVLLLSGLSWLERRVRGAAMDKTTVLSMEGA
jgi:NitT/TauT family transport system permease protein